jgi:hypothetical protein
MADILAVEEGGTLYKSQLLTYYYTRRAESSIGQGERFLIKQAYWGKTDLVTKSDEDGWDIADIPLDFSLDDLQTHFATNDLICTVQGTTITINISLPREQLEAGSRYDFNTLVLVDSEGEPFAVMCTQQETMYAEKSYNIFLTIEQVGGTEDDS